MYEDKKLFYNIVITDIFQKDLKKKSNIKSRTYAEGQVIIELFQIIYNANIHLRLTTLTKTISKTQPETFLFHAFSRRNFRR